MQQYRGSSKFEADLVNVSPIMEIERISATFNRIDEDKFISDTIVSIQNTTACYLSIPDIDVIMTNESFCIADTISVSFGLIN